MLKKLGYESLDQLTDAAVPDGIKFKRDLNLSPAISEVEAIKRIKAIAAKNKVGTIVSNFVVYLSVGTLHRNFTVYLLPTAYISVRLFY